MNAVFAELSAMKGFDEGFWHGLFEGVFHLVTMGLIVTLIGFVYQRYRDRATARREVADEVDEFMTAVYKPRKIYQRLLSREGPPPGMDSTRWEAWRAERIEELIGELIDATGRFRAAQVKIVALFGYNSEVFARYLAIWKYLKEIRSRMEQRQTLLFHHETAQSVDSLYRLVDSFRDRIAVEKVDRTHREHVRPPHDVLVQLRAKGDTMYAEYFEAGKAIEPPVKR